MAQLNEREPAGPLHTEHIRVERRKTPWLWLLLPIVAIGLLAYLFLPSRTQQATVTQTAIKENTTTTKTEQRPITYKNVQWVYRGVPETFPASQAKRIATSKEGFPLYVNSKQGYLGGGGGVVPVDNTISVPSGRVYLKLTDGRYQPLFIKQ